LFLTFGCLFVFLGAGESGKSTLLKQMKLIHDGGYSRDEREAFKEIIFSNTVQSMRVIIEAMNNMGISYEQSHNRHHASVILELPSQIECESLPAQVTLALKSLWNDNQLQQVFDRSREYQLNDSAK
jgi:guanine nucleotide-binding protein subunit alpha